MTGRLRENRRFVVVLVGEGASMMGDAAFGIVLAWLVHERFGSVATLTLVMLAQALPRAALLLWAPRALPAHHPPDEPAAPRG